MKKFKVELGVWQFNMPAEIKRVCKTEALLAEKSNGFNNKGKGIIVCVEDDKVEEFKTLYIKGVEKYKNYCESNGYVARSFGGLVEVTEPATVQPEVKAAEVKEEIMEETEMSDNMVIITTKEFNAILEAARTSVTVKETVKTVYPADYESLKKELEISRKTTATWQSKYTELQNKYDALVAEMAAAKKDTLVKAINEPMTEEEKAAWNIPEKKVIPSLKEELKKDDDDSPFDEKFCEDNKAFKEEKKEDCLFGDDFVFSTDYIEQVRAIRDIIGYTGVTEDRTVYTCRLNKENKISFTNGYEFVSALTETTRTEAKWNEVVNTLTAEREGRNILSKNVRSQLKAYFEEGLSKKEIGEAMSLCE